MIDAWFIGKRYGGMGVSTYVTVNNLRIPRIVVDVYSDAAKGRYF